MDLIKSVLSDPMKTGVATVGGAALSHFVLGLDFVFTGGIVLVGAYLVFKAL